MPGFCSMLLPHPITPGIGRVCCGGLTTASLASVVEWVRAGACGGGVHTSTPLAANSLAALHGRCVLLQAGLKELQAGVKELQAGQQRLEAGLHKLEGMLHAKVLLQQRS